jgi:aspartyl-tRNA(Asn)/glutamyl-tRNA(Gln) amidotransferase subunit A
MTTGGSSAGAAACAALNIGCIHIGTDGAGSVRIPAAFTGVFGIKPTYGRVPAWPSSTMGFLAHLGPLSRSVEDSMRAMRVIAAPDQRDMTAVLAGSLGPDAPASLKGMRVAWSPKLGGNVHLDPEVAALTEAAVKKFADLGAHVEQVDPGFDDPVDALNTLWFAGAALVMQSYSAEQKAKMDPGLVAIAEAGAAMSGAAYCEALLVKRNALAGTMARFHERFDLLLTPAMPLPAFKVGQLMPDGNRYGDKWTGWSPFTYPFNLTQQPASSVPCGLTRNGLPVGLQIIGRFGEDLTVLMASQAYEAAAPFARIAAPRGSAS